MLYRIQDLRRLCEVYCLGTGISPRQLGLTVCGNHALVQRIQAGKGCHSSNVETMSGWFNTNWPLDLAWPENIKRER